MNQLYVCERATGRKAGVPKHRKLITSVRLFFSSHKGQKEINYKLQVSDPFFFFFLSTNSSVIAWRILGTGEPGGLPSTGSHRVGHD